MATLTVKLDTRRKKADGNYPIKLYIRHNKDFFISTTFSCSKENWDGNLYKKTHPNFMALNITLRDIVNKAENVILDLTRSDKLKRTSDSTLKKLVEEAISVRGNLDNKYFIDYLDEFVEKKTNLGTKKVYNTIRNKLLKFDSKCTFDSMDKKWLTAFEQWMAKTMKINAYAINLRNIRAVFNYAIDEGYTNLYPFRKFQIKKETTSKRSLSIEQLRMLRDYPCEEHLEKYRDIFMLMFYLIGINAVDLFLAKKKDVVNGRLEYRRHKTGKFYSIKLEPEAMEIIKRYSGNKANGYLLNIMDRYKNYQLFLHRMVVGLKQIGEVKRIGLGGKKIREPLFSNISSYWARHSWATIAAELDIPKEIIGHALGHAWAMNTTTDIYIKFNEQKIDKANRKIIDYFMSKKVDYIV